MSRLGLVCLAGRQLLAAEILGGRRGGTRIEANTLMFYDLETRELLRTRTNPLAAGQVKSLRGARPAGPPPRIAPAWDHKLVAPPSGLADDEHR